MAEAQKMFAVADVVAVVVVVVASAAVAVVAAFEVLDRIVGSAGGRYDGAARPGMSSQSMAVADLPVNFVDENEH